MLLIPIPFSFYLRVGYKSPIKLSCLSLPYPVVSLFDVIMLVRRKASSAATEANGCGISVWQNQPSDMAETSPSRRVLKVFVIATFESVAGLALADLSSWHGNDRETRATHVLRRQR